MSGVPEPDRYKYLNDTIERAASILKDVLQVLTARGCLVRNTALDELA